MIDSEKYGVSFSLKQCRAFRVDPHACLDWLITQGWRRFRLMTYWNEHEKNPGTYNFKELDWQLDRIRKANGVVTLCLGVKQPRWPEYHWPDWAWQLAEADRTEPLLAYLEAVVEHVKDRPEIISYQLENEALLKGFGRNIHIERQRLRKEYSLVKRLDPSRPIVMSTSNGWGVPLRRPRPDVVGFSVYTIMHAKGKYRRTIQKPWLHRLRRHLTHQPVFVHELQCEPWGPDAIWKISPEEQAKSMSPERIAFNIYAAQKIGAYPIDLWGAEWWYWCYLHDDTTIYETIVANL